MAEKDIEKKEKKCSKCGGKLSKEVDQYEALYYKCKVCGAVEECP